MQVFVAPMLIIGFSINVFFTNYYVRAISMVMIGLANVKIMNAMVSC
jgi:hypothetical protein